MTARPSERRMTGWLSVLVNALFNFYTSILIYNTFLFAANPDHPGGNCASAFSMIYGREALAIIIFLQSAFFFFYMATTTIFDNPKHVMRIGCICLPLAQIFPNGALALLNYGPRGMEASANFARQNVVMILTFLSLAVATGTGKFILYRYRRQKKAEANVENETQ